LSGDPVAVSRLRENVAPLVDYLRERDALLHSQPEPWPLD
jgi:hypothetical protein